MHPRRATMCLALSAALLAACTDAESTPTAFPTDAEVATGDAEVAADAEAEADTLDTSPSSDASSPSDMGGAGITLKLLRRTGENPFANVAYECDACSFEQFVALEPPPGWMKSAPQIILPTGELTGTLEVEGVPRTLDFIPEIPGEEFELIARGIDGQLLASGGGTLMVVANLQRKTRMHFAPGQRVHELTNPDGEVFVLFAYQVDAPDFDRSLFENEDAMADYPTPADWRLSTRILTDPLVLDATDVVTVLSIRADTATVWERR